MSVMYMRRQLDLMLGLVLIHDYSNNDDNNNNDNDDDYDDDDDDDTDKGDTSRNVYRC